MTGTPREGDLEDPFLKACFREADSLRTAWRGIYKLPISDPRNQAADDATVLEDLVIYKRALLQSRRAAGVAMSPEDLEAAAKSAPEVVDGFLDAIREHGKAMKAQERRAEQALHDLLPPPPPPDKPVPLKVGRDGKNKAVRL